MWTLYYRATVCVKSKWRLPFQVKKFDSLWLMQKTKNITAGLGVKISKSSSLYHCIRIFLNLRQGENDPNDTFKLRWDNVYETMDLAGGGIILRSDQLVKVDGDQVSSKEIRSILTRSRQCVYLWAPTKIVIVNCWSNWGAETMSAGMSILSQPHQHWNFWYSKKVGFRETRKFQLTKTEGIKEDSSTKSVWYTHLLNRME